jgi:hypothetical protein
MPFDLVEPSDVTKIPLFSLQPQTTLFNLVEHLDRQKEWSFKTFGPKSNLQGLLQHILKELIEIEAKPDDIDEWIDVVILAFDGAWRQGYSSEDIARALFRKQYKNELRKWPDWRTVPEGQAIEHIKDSGDEENKT